MQATQQHKDLVAWLESTGNCQDVYPVNVHLKDKTFVSAAYISPHRVSKYDDGLCYYCIGMDPRIDYKRPRKTCFRLDNDDWYIACYYNQQPPENLKQFHPFGHNFILMCWGNWPDDIKIDTYERKPYDRVTMAVDYL